MASNTVPIFAPDGTLGDVPYEQMHAALAAGGKPGVTIKSPDGKLGVVPADRSLEAVHAGGQIVPLKDQETQHPGFWQSLYENTPLKGVVDKASELMQDPDKIQSLPYDLVAGLVNSQANEMKKGAALRAQGHTAEGLAHSAMGRLPVVGPILAQGAENVGTALGQGNYRAAAGAALGTAGTLLAPKIAEEAGPAAKAVAESRPGQSVGVVAKAVSKLPVIDKVVKAGKTLGELKDVWSEQPPPAEPDATSPKQNYAGENYGPMDKPKVGGEPDATRENVPNAGEDWTKQPPDATGNNAPYAGENWSKKPTSISQVAKPDVDTAAYMQAVKENGGKIDASVSDRALEIKKSWAAQSPKAQASIPTPATVEPSPSSEAYQDAPTPEGTRVPGENEDLTNLLTKSVEKAKAPEYDEATIAEARRQLTEQGYDPDHIELALKSLTGKAAPEPTIAPRARVEDQMGMSVDEQFRNHPAGPQPPFPQAAYEKALAGSDAIKNKLSSLKGVKVPREAEATPEQIKALLTKYQKSRTGYSPNPSGPANEAGLQSPTEGKSAAEIAKYNDLMELQAKQGYPLPELLKKSPELAKAWMNYEGQPTMKIYRGAEGPGTPISRGNYVTLNREGAAQYGPHIEELEVPSKHLRYMRGHINGNPKLLDQGGTTELVYSPPKTARP